MNVSIGRPWIERGLLVLAVAIALRAWVLFDVQDAPFWSVPMVDEIAYLRMSERVVHDLPPENGAWYMTPGYAWFLAAAAGLGAQVPQVKMIQCVLGVLSAWLVFLLGRRCFDARVGTVAGLLWAMAPSALLHEVLVLKPTLTVFTCLLGLWAIARPGARWTWWALGGLAFGAAALLRGEMAFVGLAVASGGLLAVRRGWPLAPGGSRGPIAFALVLAVVVAVPTAQNVARGGGFVLIAYSGGPNFYIGNHAGADGSYLPLRPDRGDALFEEQDAVQLAREDSSRALDAAGVSRYWWGRGLQWWREHPVDALGLTAKKAVLVWSAWEGHDVLSRELAARWVAALHNPLARALLLSPLALVGIVFLRERARAWPLLVFAAATWIALVPFFVFERFRVPMLAVATIFAAHALVLAFDRWRSGVRAPVLAAGLATIALAGVLALPSVARDESVLRVNVGGMLMHLGRFDEALVEFEAVRRSTPSAGRVEINIATALDRLGRAEEALGSAQRALDYLYAEGRATGRPAVQEIGYCHELAGDLETKLGRPDPARAHYEAALRLAPQNARLRAKLAAIAP